MKPVSDGVNEGIQLGRIIAALMVVYIHERSEVVSLVFETLCQFAVPFFFVTSGFFFGRHVRVGDAPYSSFNNFAKRLFFLFCVWSLIYSVIPLGWFVDLRGGELLSQVAATFTTSWDRFYTEPWMWLLDGVPGGTHLWFLTALLSAATIVWLGARFKQMTLLWCVAILLFALGMFGGRWQNTVVGLDLGINTRVGPFQSTLLFALGWWLSLRRFHNTGRKQGVLLFLVGVLLVVAEGWILESLQMAEMLHVGYPLAVIPLGLGSFLIFNSYPNLGKSDFLGNVSKLTLGIYLMHLLLRQAVASVDNKLLGSAFQLDFLALFLVTTVVVAVAFKMRFSRRLVS